MALTLGAAMLASELPLVRNGRSVVVDDYPLQRNPPKRFKKYLSEYNTPPKSMSEGTAYLYSKKPNIQWWQNKYGENVIDKSVSELQAIGI